MQVLPTQFFWRQLIVQQKHSSVNAAKPTPEALASPDHRRDNPWLDAEYSGYEGRKDAKIAMKSKLSSLLCSYSGSFAVNRLCFFSALSKIET